MQILVLGMNYWPECTSVGPFTTDMCEYLASLGHQVRVVTSFPHYPEWQVQDEYRGRWFQHEKHAGVDVYRVYVYIPGKGKASAVKRILYDTTFASSALLRSLWFKADVILAIGPPIQIGITAYLLSLVKRAPFGFVIKDIVPDAAVQLGMLRNPWVVRAAHLMERLVYNRATRVSVICHGFLDNLRSKHVPEEKLVLLPDWVDLDFIRPVSHPTAFRPANGLDPNQFFVLHAGNMGTKQGLGNLVSVGPHLQHPGEVLVLLVGDGSEREFLARQAADMPNVRLLPLQPKGMLPDMLSSAGALLINQRADVVDMALPSKLLTYMAAGRPVVAAVHEKSETARYIGESGCGIVVPPENPPALAQAIERLHANPELATHLGQRGRAYAEEHFARDDILRRYAELLDVLAGRNGRQGILSKTRQEAV